MGIQASDMSWSVMNILTRIRIPNRHQRIEIEIAKTREKRITMLRRKLQHCLCHRMSKIAAARLAGASLRDVETDMHDPSPAISPFSIWDNNSMPDYHGTKFTRKDNLVLYRSLKKALSVRRYIPLEPVVVEATNFPENTSRMKQQYRHV
jgi:hypothetical protein